MSSIRSAVSASSASSRDSRTIQALQRYISSASSSLGPNFAPCIVLIVMFGFAFGLPFYATAVISAWNDCRSHSSQSHRQLAARGPPDCGRDIDTGFLLFWHQGGVFLAGIIMQYPMGKISDERGRFFAVRLSTAGLILYLLTLLVSAYEPWVGQVLPSLIEIGASLFILLGGGGYCALNILLSALNDEVPAPQRTLVFSLAEGLYGGSVALGLAAGRQFEELFWVPITLSLVLSISLLAGTKYMTQKSVVPDEEVIDRERQPLLQPILSEESRERARSHDDQTHSQKAIFGLGISIFFLLGLARGELSIPALWPILHVGWVNKSETSFLLLSQAFALDYMLVHLIILPVLTVLLRNKFNYLSRDMFISRTGVAFMALKFVLYAIMNSIFMAKNIPQGIVWTGYVFDLLGMVALITIKSMLFTAMPAEYGGRLFAVTSLAYLFGTLLTGFLRIGLTLLSIGFLIRILSFAGIFRLLLRLRRSEALERIE